ncbi:uncharacterized protein LOC135107292 isoform X2 [Scylla paramamosain]|uniref:uncharacterized protein LOC135107292 isoform X2 n=1 Tax=Scylla paramamosain TaxID=85552 RepID=UPI003083929D
MTSLQCDSTTTEPLPLRMGEHKCVVSYCCCGCSLRSGSLAIGIVVLILSLLNAIYNIIAAIRTGVTVGWIGFATNLFVVIVSCILIMGIRQERRGFVMTWVITMVVIIIINIITSIIALVTTFSLVAGLIVLVVMGVFIYLVVVVRSYALTLGSSAGVAETRTTTLPQPEAIPVGGNGCTTSTCAS